jgi:D-alanyl-D-alanine dipeptidase
MIEAEELESIPQNKALAVSRALPKDRSYVLPRVNVFLLELSADFYVTFGTALTVDSAVRSASVQRRLRRFNASAAPVDGETASSHEAGCTVDLSRRLTRAQQHWLEYRLAYYEYAQQRIIVEQERNCFHIMVVW